MYCQPPWTSAVSKNTLIVWQGCSEAGSHILSALGHLKIGTQDTQFSSIHKPLHLEKAMFSSSAFAQAGSPGFPFFLVDFLEQKDGLPLSPSLPLPPFLFPTLQPATCAFLPSARTCARLNTPSAATHSCWRAPCPRSCHPSTWPPGCLCPTPGSAPTRWQEKRSELTPGHKAMATGPRSSPSGHMPIPKTCS